MKKLLLVLCVALTLTGCKKKAGQEPVMEVATEPARADHAWYYFTNSNVVQIQLPQVSRLQSLKPWTENIRVSDANTDADGNGFLLVNRLGVLIFERTEEPTLVHDVRLFGSSTAENLVFERGTPYFTLYRNAFFNTAIAESASSNENRPYLVRVSRENRMLYPALTYGDLDVHGAYEIVGTVFDGDSWISAVKKTDDERTNFAYKQWKPLLPLESMQPVTKAGKVTIASSSEDVFYTARAPQDFSAAPERLRSLLRSIPADFPFLLTCYTAGGVSPRRYVHGDDGIAATALIADGWVCAVFADGTTYFNGALQGRAILNDGANVAFRLPKLPKDYHYTRFCMSGDFLIVGWEESNFYRTGRSGILVVDMAKIFYDKP